MDERLEKIKDFAAQAHGNQQRKFAPELYIVHTEQVMKICQEFLDDTPVLAAALLHDIFEKTTTRKSEVLEFLFKVLNPLEAEKTFKLIVELTDLFEESAFPHWTLAKRQGKEANRISTISATAQSIKYADILDNTRERVKYAPSSAAKYLKEVHHVLTLATNGDKALHQLAINEVMENMQALEISVH